MNPCIDDDSVVVIGAGAVGVCCALELQARGCDVTLVDRHAPGSQTSYGNAGVISRSSMLPFNNPRLLGNLPTLLRNRSPQFRYRPMDLLHNAGWCVDFIRNSRGATFEATVTALDALIKLSIEGHLRLVAQAGAAHLLQSNGWLHAYRGPDQIAASAMARKMYDRYGIDTRMLSRAELRSLEPGLNDVYEAALWIKDTLTVSDPGALVRAYADLFAQRGGRILRDSVERIERVDGGTAWQVGLALSIRAKQVVVAAGPWSRELVAPLGIVVPMAMERGYHMHYALSNGTALGRPLLDGAAGFVIAPMAHGLRLTTGVEFVRRSAAASSVQLDLAERAARSSIPFGERLDETAWRGDRPTLPDSRPAIGPVKALPGLWLAIGHQHIGLNTATGTGSILATMLCNEPPPIDPAPFAPDRFDLNIRTRFAKHFAIAPQAAP